jgi:hypothetical protein
MAFPLPILSSDEEILYGKIYRCESCSHFSDPNGVFPFASRSAPLGQTVPVSHFGNIRTALLWLLLTNPRGTDRSDSNVGLLAGKFAANRGAILPTDVPTIFQHFSNYNFDISSPDFWEPWKALLNDIRIGEKEVRFDSGGICAVDLIKCPTRGGWMGYVMKKEGKEVWENCHCSTKRNGHLFLAQQIQLHKPLIVIRPGTAFNGKGNTPTYLGTKRGPIPRKLNALIVGSDNYVKEVRCTPERLTIELGGAGEMGELASDAGRLQGGRFCQGFCVSVSPQLFRDRLPPPTSSGR